MKYLYSFSVFLYHLVIKGVSLFFKKAGLRTKGVKQSFQKLSTFKSEHTVWVHCASLGEFEQGRPLIEKIKDNRPEIKIVLSFFSPSGYEIRKTYELADLVIYLPYDSKRNAKKLLDLMKPKCVLFIKYEFWYWYINEIKKRNIPLFLISGIFRDSQIFFKFYGSFFRKILGMFSQLFLQNQESQKLIESIGLNHTMVTGDTRFDRVFHISKTRNRVETIEAFKADKQICIAGSTWKPDAEIIFDFISKTNRQINFIIVPHEIDKNNIDRICGLTTKKTIKYSEADKNNITSAQVLIIDNIGMLSSIYAYADIAYIGGGFGKGIHNTLEAAVYGIPVIFGPNYKKFDEAKELIRRKAGFSITGKAGFSELMDKFLKDPEFRKVSGNQSERYVMENIGATDKVFNEIQL
jgi:3-deoxy-D-manno-octulosonic-acid transferase